jgi:hypothetical protein
MRRWRRQGHFAYLCVLISNRICSPTACFFVCSYFVLPIEPGDNVVWGCFRVDIVLLNVGYIDAYLHVVRRTTTTLHVGYKVGLFVLGRELLKGLARLDKFSTPKSRTAVDGTMVA